MIFDIPRLLLCSVPLHLSGEIECDICGRKYKTRTGYNLHRRAHFKQFNYKCSYCEKGYMNKRQLDEHMTKHTSIPVAVCNLCGFKAMSYWGYKGHMKRHADGTHK